MPKHAWMCLYIQDFEQASNTENATTLNMAKFWIWQGSQYVSVAHRSEYVRIFLDRVLYIS